MEKFVVNSMVLSSFMSFESNQTMLVLDLTSMKKFILVEIKQKQCNERKITFSLQQ